MFTGIVQTTVKVIGVESGAMAKRLTLQSEWDDLKLGDSMAINGCCLTVAHLGKAQVGFDVIKETLDKTNLGVLKLDDDVNVERSLRAGDRIDGHFVQGHVDGTGKLLEQIADEKEWRLTIEAPPPLLKYIVPKGSIALDGVSLTIAAIQGPRFDVALIPTTLKLTTLGNRPLGWPFNLEADILTKTIVHYLENSGFTANIQASKPGSGI